MADEAMKVLLEDNLAKRIFEEGRTAIRRWDCTRMESLFEEIDDLKVDFDFAVQDSPAMHGMLTLVLIATGKWQNMCLAAMEPVSQNLRHLKGRRMETIKAMLGEVMRSNQDFVRNLFAAGLVSIVEQIQAEVDLHRLPDSSGFVVAPRDPVRIMGTKFGFKYLRDLSFPASVVCYLVAQTMKALKGETPHILASVSLIVAFWLMRMGIDLRSMYKKIYD